MARRLFSFDGSVEKVVGRLDPGDVVFSRADGKIYEVYVDAVSGRKKAHLLVERGVTLIDGTVILTVEDIWEALQGKHGKVLFEDLV